MKRLFTVLCIALFIHAVSFAQLTGTKSIPGDYPTIAAAITALNTQGVGAGGVIFDIASGHTETFSSPTDGLISTQTSSGSKTILFRKHTGGATNPKILSAPGFGSRDYIIGIEGTDYVTFDGIDVMDDPSFDNNDARAEFGYLLMKAPADTSGTQYATIKNCTITLQNVNSGTVGINVQNWRFDPVSQTWKTPILKTTRQTNSNNTFQGNTITNCFSGIRMIGYSLAVFLDMENQIGTAEAGNHITNFGGTSGTAEAIYTQSENNMTIANNLIDGPVAGGSCYAIHLQSTTNAGLSMFGNTISIQYNGTLSFMGIRDYTGSTTSATVTIHDNIVTGCTFPHPGTSGCDYINVGHGGPGFSFYNNSVTNNQYGSTSDTAVGQVNYMSVGFYPATLGTSDIYNNTVSNNTRYQRNPGNGVTYYMDFGGQCKTYNCYGNVCDNNTSTTKGTVYGIRCLMLEPIVKNIYGNSFTNLHDAKGPVIGMWINDGNNWNIHHNKIQNINGTGTGSVITGISLGSLHAPGNIYLYNNIIGGLNADITSSANGVRGIDLYGLNIKLAGIYNNTIYLNANSGGANFGATGLNLSSNIQSYDLRNNIVVNTSTPKGTGKITAILTDNLNFTRLAPTSNNNNYYAGTPSAQRLIFSDTVNNDQTMLQYRSRVYPREYLSITENPPFISGVTPLDLHLNSAIATQCESGGSPVVVPMNVTDDYDNNARYPNVGYPVNPSYPAKAPDIGADEFGGIPNDLTPPAITYTPLANISTTGDRVITATITDVNGVPTSGNGLPRLCWKLNTGGTWTYITGVPIGNSQYTFTFGAGTTLGDVIYYYVVAQDMWASPNVGANPMPGAAGYTATPPAASVPPTPPNQYTIVAPICGTFNVGVGGNYSTLTAAINDINAKGLTCPVTLILTDNTYPNETFPITLQPNGGSSSTNTLTIRPKAGMHPLFASVASGSGILKVNGFDYLIIDGSATGGTDKSIKFYNASESEGAYVIGLFSKSGVDPSTHITIKNCIVRGVSNTSVTNYGILLNPLGGGYDDITITGDSIYALNTGIYFSGDFYLANHNGQITNNVIGSQDYGNYINLRGIQLQYSDNTLISQNDIMGDINGNGLHNHAGVYILGGTTNTKITKNLIHDFYRNEDGEAPAYGAYGIFYQAESTSLTEISNNSIYGIKSSGSAPGVSPENCYGIWISSGGNIKILHNSIWLYGDVLSPTLVHDASSSCIGILGNGSITNNIELRNNILANTMLGLSGCPQDGKTYAVATRASNADNFSIIDNNDYFINGCHPQVGVMNSTNYQTIFDWRAATNQDAHSVSIDPQFTSQSNLFPTSAGIPKAGSYIASVPTDITSALRTSPPDMGAYEFTPSPSVITTAATNVTYTTATVNGTINPISNNVDMFFDYGLTTGYGSIATGTPPTVSGGVVLPVSAPLTGLSENTTYHFRLRGVTFFTNITVFGNDMTFTTPSSVPLVITVTGGITNDTCFNAVDTLKVAGTPNTFIVSAPGHVNLIAGHVIRLLPGAKVNPGGYLHAYITLTSQYCNSLPAPTATNPVKSEDFTALAPEVSNHQLVYAYPNPTDGNFTLELTGNASSSISKVEIYSLNGLKVFSQGFAGVRKQTISASQLRPGMYFVYVTTGSGMETLKIVKL